MYPLCSDFIKHVITVQKYYMQITKNQNNKLKKVSFDKQRNLSGKPPKYNFSLRHDFQNH